MTRRGTFIVFEGGEGAGKSTVLAGVAARLRGDGCEVVETREPGGTPLGEQIRALVLASKAVDDPLAELLLFEAARAHLVASVVGPALERGAIVLCDRYSASSIAYQGSGRGLGRDVVERANAVATQGIAPDLTLLLDLPVEAGLARRAGAGEGNHFDRETIDFHERVRAGFLALASEARGGWAVLDATRPFEDVAAAALDAIRVVMRG
ncbi:MAG: dTMP kinase [Dehalococcoidia bacterium]